MRTFLILILCLSMACVAFGQRKPKKNQQDSISDGELKILKHINCNFIDDNVLPSKNKAQYKKNAIELALRLNPEQSEDLEREIYNHLIAIRVSDYSCVDSIATLYRIQISQTSQDSLAQTDILAEKMQTSWIFTYQLFWIEKEAKKQREWAFEVYEDGTVTFLYVRGDAVPAWVAEVQQKVGEPDVLKN